MKTVDFDFPDDLAEKYMAENITPQRREGIVMTVSELIEFLQKQRQDMLVAYQIYSEYAVLEAKDIEIMELCMPRPDGWVHDARPDAEKQEYLVFPGN